MFTHLPKEKLILIKTTGERYNIEALISSNSALVEDDAIIIDDGDIFVRQIAPGVEDRFLVIDRNYLPPMGSFPAHYQPKIEKITSRVHEKTTQTINNYNISDTGKVNINSTDNSVSNITYNSETLFDNLINAANTINDPEKIIIAINEMRDSMGKKSFIEKYNTFIESIANHMTIFLPFMPSLAMMLSQINQ